MVTIFGAGFGLYGYLPAIIEGINEQVCLPRKYLKAIRGRADLSYLEGKIFWVKDEIEAIQCANKVVVAVNPVRQFDIIRRCLSIGFTGHFFLEKPIAQTPQESERLLSLLDSHEVTYSVGYSFLYVDALLQAVSDNQGKGPIHVSWQFMAHHFAHNVDNWKRRELQGGGVLRFYGIHIIALLVKAGYSCVENTCLQGADSQEPWQWDAQFSHIGLPNCLVSINSRSQSQEFSVKVTDGSKCLIASDPFDAAVDTSINHDRRFATLVRFLSDLDDFQNKKSLYRKINKMWLDIETKTNFSKLVIKESIS